MAWPLRFLLWGTPLTWLACAFYKDYAQLLSQAAEWVFATAGIGVQFRLSDVIAPMDLALYGAMALASFHTPWKARLARLALGWLVLVVIEVLLVVAGVTIFLKPGVPVTTRLFLANAVGLLGWVGAPILWTLLFGAQEMPRLLSWAPVARSDRQHAGATGPANRLVIRRR